MGDVLETLDALQLERVDLIGHSFGGRLGIELAAAHPERVGALVLYDPAVWVPPPVALTRAERHRPDDSFASLAEAVDARLVEYPKTPRAWLEEELPDALDLGDDGRSRYRYARSAVITAYSEMSKPPPLEAVEARTLLIRALRSDVVPEAFADMCLELIPDCTLVTIPNGHVPMWEDFDATADLTLSFLG
jgi:lipase